MLGTRLSGYNGAQTRFQPGRFRVKNAGPRLLQSVRRLRGLAAAGKARQLIRKFREANMSDLGVQPVAGVAPGLSQMQRLTNTFTAPSKTFEDIKRGHRSWWLPFLLSALVTYIFFFAITSKVGWATVADNMVRMNPKAEERMSQLTPEQRETQMKGMRYGTEGFFAAAPVVFGLGFTAAIAAVLLGTINFGFGGRATYGS